MIRIGFSGHRLLTNRKMIIAGIQDALTHIKATYPTQTWAILSSLAEGADCLFAEKALQYQSAKLIVPLPLPVEEYLKSFSSNAARSMFTNLFCRASETIQIEPQPTSEEAYLAAGLYIVHHCDILVTIWDGQEARGVGGTGQIVDYARDERLPIVWIQAGDHLVGTRVSIEPENRQGIVIYERFPQSTIDSGG
jgi:hypothetical protein